MPALQDVNTKINFGPVWRLLQGFGQCCGFPVTGEYCCTCSLLLAMASTAAMQMQPQH